MAITPVKKIQIAAVAAHKDKILEILQDYASAHIINIVIKDKGHPLEKESNEELQEIRKTELDYANIEYVIKMLTPYGKKRGLFSGPITITQEELYEKTAKTDINKIVKTCTDAEDIIALNKTDIIALKNDKILYTPWKNLPIDLRNFEGTVHTKIITGTFKTFLFQRALKELNGLNNLVSIETIHKNEKNCLTAIIFSRELEKEIKQILTEFKFEEMEMPQYPGFMSEYLKTISEKITTCEKTLQEQENKLRKAAKKLDNLRILHDILSWKKDKIETTRKIANTRYSFIINAWIPEISLEKLEKQLAEKTDEFNIIQLNPEEGENPPVLIQNKKSIMPFEILTRMYGLPKHDEVDPTPFLSIFFIIYFALCLTDAAYGIIMFTAMLLALKFLKMNEGVKRLVKLLMYGGITTTIIGTLFGGWFGLEADKVPSFLTYTNESGEKMFLLQKINAITNPLGVMIIALALGYFQLVFGVYIKFIHSFVTGNKKEALLDNGTWAFMLTGIGFYILTMTGIIPSFLQSAGQWWIIVGAIGLILTQGRSNKNPIAKILSGILSLYGLVGYMSDVLSYSRLLALGLATSIIGLAVNVIVGLAINLPYIGWLVAAIIFVGGHSFNLLINALGSFIHAGRLQFVEFFTKFMEGGGTEFQPLTKKSKYILIKNN